MNDILPDRMEICFPPKCELSSFSSNAPYPSWFIDPWAEIQPTPYCPACGKPRWLPVPVEEMQKYDLEVYPQPQWDTYLPIWHGDDWKGILSIPREFRVEVYARGRPSLVAILADVRVNGMSSREHHGYGPADTCLLDPSTRERCTRTYCNICGNHGVPLVTVFCVTGDEVTFCRDGHFHDYVINPHTGHDQAIFGPKMIDGLLWAPELWVPRLKERWWAEPEVVMGECG